MRTAASRNPFRHASERRSAATAGQAVVAGRLTSSSSMPSSILRSSILNYAEIGSSAQVAQLRSYALIHGLLRLVCCTIIGEPRRRQ